MLFYLPQPYLLFWKLQPKWTFKRLNWRHSIAYVGPYFWPGPIGLSSIVGHYIGCQLGRILRLTCPVSNGINQQKLVISCFSVRYFFASYSSTLLIWLPGNRKLNSLPAWNWGSCFSWPGVTGTTPEFRYFYSQTGFISSSVHHCHALCGILILCNAHIPHISEEFSNLSTSYLLSVGYIISMSVSICWTGKRWTPKGCKNNNNNKNKSSNKPDIRCKEENIPAS